MTPSNRRSLHAPMTQSEPKVTANSVGSTGNRKRRRTRPLSGSTATTEPPASVAPVRGLRRPASVIQSVLPAATRLVGARASGTRNATFGASAIPHEAPPRADAPAKVGLTAMVPATAAERRRDLSRFVVDSSVASSHTPDHPRGFHLKPFISKDDFTGSELNASKIPRTPRRRKLGRSLLAPLGAGRSERNTRPRTHLRRRLGTSQS
jgi:hypothetical protein